VRKVNFVLTVVPVQPQTCPVAHSTQRHGVTYNRLVPRLPEYIKYHFQKLITSSMISLWFNKWSFGAVVTAMGVSSYSTSSLVSTGMGDHLHVGIPPRNITSHPGQLSLAIPPWVGTSTGDGFGHR